MAVNPQNFWVDSDSLEESAEKNADQSTDCGFLGIFGLRILAIFLKVLVFRRLCHSNKLQISRTKEDELIKINNNPNP